MEEKSAADSDAPPTRRAVDVGLRGELGDVAGLGGAAVQHADTGGELGAEEVDEGLADSGADLLGVVGGGGHAGADGPDGLIRDDELGGVGGLETLRPAFTCATTCST